MVGQVVVRWASYISSHGRWLTHRKAQTLEQEQQANMSSKEAD